MNASINICSGPKLLANPPNPVLFVVTNGNLLEHGSVSHLPHCSVETIRERAETVTPLLKEIMDHWPSERWGINE